MLTVSEFNSNTKGTVLLKLSKVLWDKSLNSQVKTLLSQCLRNIYRLHGENNSVHSFSSHYAIDPRFLNHYCFLKREIILNCVKLCWGFIMRVFWQKPHLVLLFCFSVAEISSFPCNYLFQNCHFSDSRERRRLSLKTRCSSLEMRLEKTHLLRHTLVSSLETRHSPLKMRCSSCLARNETRLVTYFWAVLQVSLDARFNQHF